MQVGEASSNVALGLPVCVGLTVLMELSHETEHLDIMATGGSNQCDGQSLRSNVHTQENCQTPQSQCFCISATVRQLLGDYSD